MNPCKLALVCLITLFIAAPTYAAVITVNDSCSIFDAIIAANTNSPAGGCSAGSGADTIIVGPHYLIPNTDISSFGSRLRQPLPTITSAITIKPGVRPDLLGIYATENYTYNFIARLNPAIDVASGAYLTLEEIDIWTNEADDNRAMVIRPGGRVDIRGGGLFLVPEACGAIYNQGRLTISGTHIVSKSGTAGRSWTPDPGAVMIFNAGGTVSDGGNYFHNLEGTDLYMGSTGDCGAPGSAGAVSRPAPECKLEAQLQAGDRALRRGGSYSNLRAEAGISGELLGRIEGGAVVDVVEGPEEAGGYNWYRVTADEDLEGWIAEAPARSFNCAYYFVSFSGELPPEAPQETPERQECDLAAELVVGGYAIIAGGANINYRAEAGLGGSRSGTLAAGTVLEVVAGPEEADSYSWWQVRNVIEDIDGWLAQGGPVSSEECVRWLLLLDTEDDMDDDTDMDESDDTMEEETDVDESDEMTDDESESEEAVEEAAEDATP